MKKAILVLSIFLFAHPTQAFSLKNLNCAPSANSCAFYRCLETEVSCGPSGYPLNFGERLCVRYLSEEPKASVTLQHWYQDVRKCLQEGLKQTGEIQDCNDISKKAFASHVDCYVNTGFCELPFQDKFSVAATTGFDLLNPDALAMVGKVQEICKARGH